MATGGWPDTHFTDRKTEAQSRLNQDDLSQAARLLRWMKQPPPPHLGSLSTLLTLLGLSSVMRSLEVSSEDGQYPGCSLVSGAGEDSDLSEALQGPS